MKNRFFKKRILSRYFPIVTNSNEEIKHKTNAEETVIDNDYDKKQPKQKQKVAKKQDTQTDGTEKVSE